MAAVAFPGGVGVMEWTQRTKVVHQEMHETLTGGLIVIDGGIVKRTGTVTVGSFGRDYDEALWDFHQGLRGNDNLIFLHEMDELWRTTPYRQRMAITAALNGAGDTATLTATTGDPPVAVTAPNVGATPGDVIYNVAAGKPTGTYAVCRADTADNIAKIDTDSTLVAGSVGLADMAAHLLADDILFEKAGLSVSQTITYPWREV